MTKPTLEAHLTTASAAIKAKFPDSRYVLQFAVTRNGGREWHGNLYPVSGKAAGRKLAKEHGATPWNF